MKRRNIAHVIPRVVVVVVVPLLLRAVVVTGFFLSPKLVHDYWRPIGADEAVRRLRSGFDAFSTKTLVRKPRTSPYRDARLGNARGGVAIKRANRTS